MSGSDKLKKFGETSGDAAGWGREVGGEPFCQVSEEGGGRRGGRAGTGTGGGGGDGRDKGRMNACKPYCFLTALKRAPALRVRREEVEVEAEWSDVLFVGQGRSSGMYNKDVEEMGCIDPRGKFRYTRMEGCDSLQWVGSCGRYGQND